ncbi:hypothetical protein GCM10010170_018450 [Dactylosporangium salmoneum]|uniref:Uncharacterized protein n=1 Tax=Dactylosporangium salmoneum TaxID=53361 RepID=A0ABP5SS19_9ACTN
MSEKSGHLADSTRPPALARGELLAGWIGDPDMSGAPRHDMSDLYPDRRNNRQGGFGVRKALDAHKADVLSRAELAAPPGRARAAWRARAA